MGQKNTHWEAGLDTANEAGFLANPEPRASGEEINVVARPLTLFRISDT
jgi:hypothetical protein